MRILVSIMFLLGALSADALGEARQATASAEEIASLVNRLSWNSVGGECEVLGALCPDGEAAKRLVQIGKPATDELLKVLEDKDRGVAAHLVLTQIWEPQAKSWTTFARDGFTFTSNGLQWSQTRTRKGPKYRIGRDALSKNAAEWRRKIIRYRSNPIRAAA